MRSLTAAIFIIVIFGGFGVLCTVWMVVTLGRGEYLTGVVTLGFATFCFGFIVPFVKVMPGKVFPRVEFDATGTTFRPDRGIDVPIQVSVLGMVVAMSLFAIFSPLGKLDIPVPHPMRFYLPPISAAAALMGVPVLWRIVRRGGTKYLRLSPTGFKFGQGSSSPRGKWSHVTDVTDRAPGQTDLKYSAVVFVMSDGRSPTLAAASFTPGGQALRNLVRFYWQHADLRDELTDGRALKRLSAEQFEVD